MRPPKWLQKSDSGQDSNKSNADARLKQLVEAEDAEAERDKAKWQADHQGLIRYIDPKLAELGLIMPQGLSALDVLQYMASAVETRRQVEEMGHRKGLIKRILWFSLTWLLIVLIIVAFDGFEAWGFDLDASVLVALVTTTTANVLGLAFIILRGLFYKEDLDHTPSGSDSGRAS